MSNLNIVQQAQISPAQANALLQQGNPVDMSAIPRALRLELINQVLETNTLRRLEGLGDASQGQIEFVGINSITPDPVKPGAFVTRVDFQCNQPKPGGYNLLAFFNAGTTLHSGVIILPVINDEYVLMVQQFRPVLGQSTIEIPRGFVADLGNPNAIKSYGAALIELQQETGVNLEETEHKVRKEFSLIENSGTSNIVNAVLCIDLLIPSKQLNALQSRIIVDMDNIGHNLKTLFVPKSHLQDLVYDNHTAAALFKGL